MTAWKTWVDDNAGAIVDLGGPLSRTTRVGTDGITEIRNNLAAFTIVQASSREEAARLFLNHPHFAIFAGEAVEVMELLPVPQG